MFDPVSIGAASIGVNRVTRATSSTRVSDLSTRSRESEDAASSHGSAQEAAGERQGRDPVGLKAKAQDSRHGKRHDPDATEDERPRPKVKFRPPSEDGSGEPIFEAEDRPAIERTEPILDDDVVAKPTPSLNGQTPGVGSIIDVYA